MKQKTIAIIILTLLSVLLLAGCDKKSDEVTKLDLIKESGELVMLTHAGYPPFEYLDDSGALVGIDIKLGQAIADSLGVELKIVDADFDLLIKKLTSGEGDLLIAGLTVTAEREQKIDYSMPYVEKYQALIVPKDSGISMLEDLAGKTVSAQEGSSSESVLLAEINEKDGALYGKGTTYISSKGPIISIANLEEGKIDAIIEDSNTAKNILKDNPDYTVLKAATAAGKEYPKLVAIAAQKNHPELIEAVNLVILQLIQEGKIAEWEKEFE
jgi:polar amino acid transport system substrate-binding protein